jgi:hypothetical protein
MLLAEVAGQQQQGCAVALADDGLLADPRASASSSATVGSRTWSVSR